MQSATSATQGGTWAMQREPLPFGTRNPGPPEHDPGHGEPDLGHLADVARWMAGDRSGVADVTPYGMRTAAAH